MRSSSTERMASAVSRSRSTLTPSSATPSRCSCSRMNRPSCSSPTAVIRPTFNPSRAAPIAMLVGDPPTESLYEYACDEGNYAMSNVLSGARQHEKEEATAPSKRP